MEFLGRGLGLVGSLFFICILCFFRCVWIWVGVIGLFGGEFEDVSGKLCVLIVIF